MQTIAASIAIVLLVGATGLAQAQGDNPSGNHESQRQAISSNAMKQKIEARGYDIQRLELDDGVFKARIIDRESGGAVKVTFDPIKGELVRARLAF